MIMEAQGLAGSPVFPPGNNIAVNYRSVCWEIVSNNVRSVAALDIINIDAAVPEVRCCKLVGDPVPLYSGVRFASGKGRDARGCECCKVKHVYVEIAASLVHPNDPIAKYVRVGLLCRVIGQLEGLAS